MPTCPHCKRFHAYGRTEASEAAAQLAARSRIKPTAAQAAASRANGAKGGRPRNKEATQ